MILHALDGYDEISLTGPFKVISNQTEQVLEPEQLGLSTLRPEALAGGQTLDESAQIFMNVLNDEATSAQTQAVLANSAMALLAAGTAQTREDAVAMARESLESGRALACFKKLICPTSNGHPSRRGMRCRTFAQRALSPSLNAGRPPKA